jgi:hypothetical protein
MINKPTRRRKKAIAQIYTLDIETDARGELIDIGFYNGERIKYFQTWEGLLKDLDSIDGESLIYAHNGGGFDYVNMLVYLFGAGIKFEAMLKQSKIFCFWLIDKPYIKFVDSFNIFQSSLEKVTASFSELEKLEIDKENYKDMRGFKQRERELYYRYLDRDCIALYQAIIKMRSLVNEVYELGNLPLSIGGISMRLFGRAFLNEKIVTPSKTEKEFTFNAYVGGRCEYLGFGACDSAGWYENVNGYDFNSHYPAQMLGAEFPIRRGVYVADFVRDPSGQIEHGIYIVKFRQDTGRIPLLQNCDGEYSFEGFGTFTHTELNEIEATGGRVTSGCGYYYPETAPIFDAFVKYFYEKKFEATKISDSARTIFYKWVLNNLYGKFGQRDTVESLQVLSRQQSDEQLERGAELNEFYRIDSDYAFYDVKSEKKCYTSFPAIACMITASARIVLNRVLESCANPLYCDTDSVHCQDTLAGNLIGDGLGKLKIEFANTSARYGGKKSYEIADNKKRQKGIPKDAVTREFFDNLFAKGFTETNFNRPLLLKSAIRKIDIQSPSMFTPFKRTITRDQSLKEKLEKTYARREKTLDTAANL